MNINTTIARPAKFAPLGLALLVLALGCIAASSVRVQAQPARPQPAAIETIEVIGRRQPYRGNVDLQELPQSVTVLADALLDDLGIDDFQSAMELAPSTARQNNFGGLWESFAIRGFAGDENLPSAYLINGFSAGRGYSGLRDVSNIQAIEISKGPGSALYGRGEPGGTVNIVTKKPQFDPEGYVRFTAGEFSRRRFEGDYTAALGDGAAFRINGAYEDSESYRDTVEVKKTALSPSLLLRLGDSTSLLYELETLSQEIPFDRGVPVLDGLDLPESRFLGEPGDGPIEVEASGHQLTLQHELSGDWFLSAGLGSRVSSLEGYASETQLGEARQLLYTDGMTVNRFRRYRDYDADDLSFRFELSGTFEAAGVRHNLLLGADNYDYELDSEQHRWRIGWNSGDRTYSVNAFNPMYGQPRPETPPQTDTLEEQEATGFYVQDLIELSTRLHALVGVRFDDFEQTITNRRSDSVSSQSQSEVNPRFGLVYEMDQRFTAYLSYSEGFRPNAGTGADGDAFEPEKSESFEVGLKWASTDGGFSGAVALFDAEKSNILTSDPVNAGFSAALGEAMSSGYELELQARLGDSTNLAFNYAYTDAHTANDTVNLDWGVDIPAGSRLINVPEQGYNILLDHSVSLAGRETKFGVHIQYVDSRLGETIDPDYELPDYTLVNLFGRIRLSERMELHASVGNLFDEEHYVNSYSALWTMPGPPVHYQATINYSLSGD